MKATYLILFFLLRSIQAESLPKLKQFSIIQKANDYFLLKKRDEMKAQLKKSKEKKLELMKINVGGANPSLVGIEDVPVAKDFYCVVYKAGESGTSTIIIEQRCALYNKKNLRFEGDIPYKYIPKGKTAKAYPQPVYKNKDGLLKIYDNDVLIKTFSVP